MRFFKPLGGAALVAVLVVAFQWERVLLNVLRIDWITGAYVAVWHEHRINWPTPDVLEPLTLRLSAEQNLPPTDPRYASVAIDSSLWVGGHWWSKRASRELIRGRERTQALDLSRPQLRTLTQALAPAYLRVGGTEADHIYYGVTADAQDPPPPFELYMTQAHWDSLLEFIDSVGLDLYFTLNAGPGTRDANGAWTPDNALRLLQYASAEDNEVAVWELGNEVNVYRFVHGKEHRVTGEQVAQDVRRLKHTLRRYFTSAQVVAPAAFILPGVGEPLEDDDGVLDDFTRWGLQDTDAITWHFYPQQSRRCWSASRRAKLTLLLEPRYLDEVGRWSDHITELRDRGRKQVPLWLGETGNAQCGGEPGVSDRYVSGLWWLDQLGLMAKAGQKVVVRQTLVGSHYGLIDEETLAPRPDYYNTLLWKRLMGVQPLSLDRQGRAPRLRAYAHCTPASWGAPPGAVTLLVLNLSQEQEGVVQLIGWHTPHATVHRFSAPSLGSATLLMDGQPVTLAALQKAWPGPGAPLKNPSGELRVAPVSYSFLLLPEAAVSACSTEQTG
jgi:heparanase